MDIRVTSLSVIAAAAFAVFSSGVATAASRTDARSDEVSAAQQQQPKRQVKRQTRKRAAAAYAYRPPVYPVPRYGRAADPSIAPNGRPYPRPNYMGGCVIDEGYGRWSTCPNH